MPKPPPTKSKALSEKGLKEVKSAMIATKPTAELAVELFAKFDVPKYVESDNIMMALEPTEKYGFIGDRVLVSNGSRHNVEDYLELTNERVVENSTAKISSYNGSSFMVGALPRILLNKDKLSGTAKVLCREHESLLTYRNSLMNNLAQSIELVHSVDRCVDDIDALLSLGLKDEGLVEAEPKAGRGVGAVEAPRGILYHDYTFDNEGCIVKANVITPTAQSVANMEKDYKLAAERLVRETDETILHNLNLIARSFDPCISCSVHLIRLKNS